MQQMKFMVFCLGAVLFMSVAGGRAWAQAPFRPPAPPGAQVLQAQVEQLQKRLEGAKSDQERLQLHLVLIQQLQRLQAHREVIQTYEQLLQLPLVADLEKRFLYVLQYGGYLEQSSRPADAAWVYQRFLDRLDRELPESLSVQRSTVELRLLSVLVQSGAYREAKAKAFEILDATGATVSSPLVKSLLELAESDLLAPAELSRLEQIILDDGQFHPLVPRLIRLYADQGRGEKAVSLVEPLLERDPSQVLNLLDLIHDVYRAQFGPAGGDRFLQQLDAVQPARRLGVAGELIRVRWLDRIGRTEEAYEALQAKAGQASIYQEELASLYSAHERYAEAAEVYAGLLKRDGGNTGYLRRLGDCFLLLGRKAEAVASWDRIPSALGKNAASYEFLSEIYESHGLYAEAIAALKRARDRGGPKDSNLSIRILDLWFGSGDDEALLREYLQTSLWDGGREPFYRRRIVDQLQREPERAVQLQEILLRRLNSDADEKRREFLRLLGVDLWVAVEEYQRAVAFINAAYSNRFELGRRLSNLGFEISHLGALDEAVAAWAQVPWQSPHYPVARTEMARVSLEQGRLNEARQGAKGLIAYLTRPRPLPAAQVKDSTFEFYMKTLPRGEQSRFIQALLVLAQVDLRQKRPSEALKALLPLQGVRRLGQPGMYSLFVGHAYSQLGSLDTAESHYRRAAEQAPPRSSVRSEAEFHLAEVLLWREETEEAMERYLQLAREDPRGDFVNEALRRYLVLAFAGAEQLYHYTLATLEEWKGDGQEAVRLYREAAADDAESDVAGWCLYEAARRLLAMGQPDAARKQIEHILGRYEHPTLMAECRVLLTKLPGGQPDVAGVPAEATGPYLDLVLEYPDSLYSDLARLKLDGRLAEPF